MTTHPLRTDQTDEATRLRLWARMGNAAMADLAEVRITPYRHGDGRFWCVMALGCERREVPLPKGAPATISAALRAAFPLARWDVAQDYDITTGVLTEHITPLPACLLDGAA
ncbi:hypothetical protein ACIOHE_39330 [Streptomyces sp. NPDC087851]|uniref:hypothetical protein n=1 Tax=Streptomyces sp. NPDC087851 TaxID=3365810 RepID=UPI0037FCE5FD